MDWQEDTGTNLWVFPRGTARDDGLGGTLTWTSTFGSIVASVHDLMTVDGVNEAGLAAHQLFLPESNYGEPDGSRPALSVAVWMQYILDTFDTVASAVAWMAESQLQIVMQADPHSGNAATLHLALEDATGDSAIIEYLDGVPQIHHDRSYTVMTNSPPFPEQLALLKEVTGFGGDQPLPGGTPAHERFARAAFYVDRLPEPQTKTEAVASLLSVIRNASQPFRTPDPQTPHASQTRWRTLIDVTERLFVFEATNRPNIVWARLDAFDLSEGASTQRLELTADLGLEGGLVGDVSTDFVASTPLAFLSAI